MSWQNFRRRGKSRGLSTTAGLLVNKSSASDT